MESDTIWRTIDQQRGELADILDTLAPQQWSTASLCTGWTVRDVAVHITQSQLGGRELALAAVKSGFRFDAMIRRAAIADHATPEIITARLRAMAGSRRRPPMTKEVDPLMDVLVHTQDICVPLGIERPMPAQAAVAVADRLWHMKFPLNPQRDLPGYRFVATDVDFAVGPQWGGLREATIRDIVMALAGRPSPALTSI
ncbi:maleylpyruvate isomerase family mycothiol-dependent enzyme [Mycolicibacterium sp. XJ870]